MDFHQEQVPQSSNGEEGREREGRTGLSKLEGSEVLEERRGEGVDLRGADAFRGKGEILLVVVDESLERIAKLLPNDLSALRDELL